MKWNQALIVAFCVQNASGTVNCHSCLVCHSAFFSLFLVKWYYAKYGYVQLLPCEISLWTLKASLVADRFAKAWTSWSYFWSWPVNLPDTKHKYFHIFWCCLLNMWYQTSTYFVRLHQVLLPLLIDQATVADFKALEHVQVALLAFIFCLLVSAFPVSDFHSTV
jgi:hypothetical protein